MINPMRKALGLDPSLLNTQRNQTSSAKPAATQQQANTKYADAFIRSAMRSEGATIASSKGQGQFGPANFRMSGHLGIQSNGIDWDRGGRGKYSHDWIDTKHNAKTYADSKWTNRADDEKADVKGTGIPVGVTLFNIGARREVTAAAVRVDGTLGGAQLSAEVYAARLRGTVGLDASADLNSMTAKVKGSARAEAHVAGVEASAKRRIGSDALNTTTAVHGRAYVGAEAGATGSVTFDPRKGDVGVSAGLDAFAGAKATGSIRQSFGAAGENIGSVKARGEAWAGIGASADASAGFQDGKLKLSASLGAALGVGGKVGFDIEIDVVGTAKAAVKTAAAAVDMASEVGDSVAKAFSSGWSAVKSFW
jgi:hypothetical protein